MKIQGFEVSTVELSAAADYILVYRVVKGVWPSKAMVVKFMKNGDDS